ncbi:MAG: hypothetical protein K5669_06210 [Lachnospiraceae bacterium]|nr:hypothetical protein [Lachnospiraceae bacterium]
MSNKLSIINIGNILYAFNASIKNWHRLFYIIPWFVGIIMPVFLYNSNEKAAGALNAFLTSFVPLFATILTFYISWCYNKIKTRHNAERLQLFRETSTNILMMIPLDVIALVLYVFASNNWFSDDVVISSSFSLSRFNIPTFLYSITWHQLIRYVFLVAYYAILTEIILILLMVCKRAFVIINNEITLLDDIIQEKETDVKSGEK